MEKIFLLEQSLDHMLEKYEAEEFDENYVDKKIGIVRLEEVDKVQEELVGEIDRFLREFPTSEMTENYRSLKDKALRIVKEFRQLIRDAVSRMMENRRQSVIVPVQASSVKGDNEDNTENNSRMGSSPPKKSRIHVEKDYHAHALLNLHSPEDRSKDVSCEGAQEWGVQESSTLYLTRSESMGKYSHQERSKVQVDEEPTVREIAIAEKTLSIGLEEKGRKEEEARDDDGFPEGRIATIERTQFVKPKDKSKEKLETWDDNKFIESSINATEEVLIVEVRTKEKSGTQIDDEVTGDEISIVDEIQPSKHEDDSEKEVGKAKRSNVAEVGQRSKKGDVKRVQNYRRSRLTTFRKMKWCEEKLKQLDEDEFRGKTKATLLRLVLERVRKQAMTEQNRFEELRKVTKEGADDAKIQSGDEEWTPGPGQTRVVSPDDEEEEREWLGLLCQKIKDEVQLLAEVSAIRESLGEVIRNKIEEAFTIPYEFKGCIYDNFYEKLKLTQDAISIGSASTSAKGRWKARFSPKLIDALNLKPVSEEDDEEYAEGSVGVSDYIAVVLDADEVIQDKDKLPERICKAVCEVVFPAGYVEGVSHEEVKVRHLGERFHSTWDSLATSEKRRVNLKYGVSLENAKIQRWLVSCNREDDGAKVYDEKNSSSSEEDYDSTPKESSVYEMRDEDSSANVDGDGGFMSDERSLDRDVKDLSEVRVKELEVISDVKEKPPEVEERSNASVRNEFIVKGMDRFRRELECLGRRAFYEATSTGPDVVGPVVLLKAETVLELGSLQIKLIKELEENSDDEYEVNFTQVLDDIGGDVSDDPREEDKLLSTKADMSNSEEEVNYEGTKLVRCSARSGIGERRIRPPSRRVKVVKTKDKGTSSSEDELDSSVSKNSSVGEDESASKDNSTYEVGSESGSSEESDDEEDLESRDGGVRELQRDLKELRKPSIHK